MYVLKKAFKNIYIYAAFCSIFICTLTLKEIPLDIFSLGLIFIGLKLKMKRNDIQWSKNIIGAIGFIPFLYVVYIKYSTLFDIEAGLSLLIILQGMKFLESENKRDLFAFFNILILIIIGQIIYNQSLLSTIFAFLSFFLVIYGLLLLEHPTGKIDLSLTRIFNIMGKHLLLGIPLVLILFILFPRYEAGFRYKNRSMGSSGFSPEANITGVDEIILSDEIVFKVKFLNGQKIPMENLYWIGSILYENDGSNWSQKGKYPRTKIHNRINQPKNKILHYRIFLQQMLQEYLFTLDRPIKKPRTPFLTRSLGEKTFKLHRINPKKFSYEGFSHFNFKQFELDKELKEKSLSLKGKFSERFEQLAKKLKAPTPTKSISNILDYFDAEGFEYTLKPGPTKTIDDFLFKNKKGFCTHFASATALLARKMGIPTRLVTGFHGGELNPYSGLYLIRKKDAHAWMEFYHNGWKRIDPVSIIRPERISLGANEFFSLSPSGEAIKGMPQQASWPVKTLKNFAFYLDKIDTDWEVFLRNFDRDFQRNLIKKWGGRYSHLLLYIVYSFLIIFIFYGLFFIFKNIFLANNKSLSVEDDYYLRLEKYFNKQNFSKDHSWTPSEYQFELKSRFPSDALWLDEFFKTYQLLKYGPSLQDHKRVSALRRLRHLFRLKTKFK